MIRKIIFGLFIFIGLLGCEDPVKTNSDLTGNWEWVSTDGGLSFLIHESPASTGNTYKLKFTDNRILVYKNENEIFSGEYTIEKKKSIYSGELEDYIKISDEYTIQYIVLNGIIKIDNNLLSISDNLYDGIGSSYKKSE